MLGASWHGRVAQRPSCFVLLLRRFKRETPLQTPLKQARSLSHVRSGQNTENVEVIV
jgi:hypothetical protein